MSKSRRTGWEMVELNSFCRPKQWKTISAKQLTNEGFPVYGANGVIGYYKEYNHEKPTLLITCRGATCGNIHLSKPFSYINGNAMCLDNLDESQVLSRYLYYTLKGRGLNDVISGSAQPQITRTNLDKIQIPLPPLPIQRQIADVLDTAEALRRNTEAQLAALDELAQSLFLELFGDPVLNEKGWEVKELGEVAEVKIGPFGSLLHREDYISDGIPLVNPSHMKGGKICVDKKLSITSKKMNSLKSYALKEDDIVLARRGEIGRCATVTKLDLPCLCGTGSMIIRPNFTKIKSTFLNMMISGTNVKKVLESQSKGVTMKNLNSKIVANLIIIVPPLPLQQHFAGLIENIESQKRVLRSALKESENLVGCLLQEVFG